MNSSRGRVLRAAAVGLATLAVSVSAAAQDPAARYKEGLRLFDHGSYAEAVDAFSESFRASNDTRYLWNLALAELRAKRPYEASEHLLAYTKRPDATPQNRVRAEALIEETSGELGHLLIAAPEGAEISLDGNALGTAPLPFAIDVHPDKPHVVIAKMDGHEAKKEIAAPGASEVKVQLVFPPEPPTPPAPAPPPIAAPSPPLPQATLLAEPASDRERSREGELPKESLLVGLVLAEGIGGAAIGVTGGILWLNGQSTSFHPSTSNQALGIGMLAAGSLIHLSMYPTMILWPRRTAEHRAELSPAVFTNGGGFSLRGSF